MSNKIVSRRIPLTQGKFAVVDSDDFERVSKYRWYANCHHTGQFRARATIPFLSENSKQRQTTLLMSRFIIGAKDGELVDHINHDMLDNRKTNLRIATHSQNARNTKKRRTTINQYKGIALTVGGKFQARIFVDGKLLHLGIFDTQKEAAIAYNKSAKKYFGKFACLNIIR